MPSTFTFVVNPEFQPWLDAKAETVMDASADVYVGEVRRRIESSEPAGRWYTSKRSRGARHHASAPGQPPAIDTGTLIQSIDTQSAGTGFQRVVQAGVSSREAATYVLALELGTSRMAPRPVWLPSLDAVRGRLGAPE